MIPGTHPGFKSFNGWLSVFGEKGSPVVHDGTVVVRLSKVVDVPHAVFLEIARLS